MYHFAHIGPEMFDLISIVMPKIMNEWEYVTYALRYDVNITKSIKEKQREDPKKCCHEFFQDWLTTNNGAKAGPKSWLTMIEALKQVNIADNIIEDIIAKVKKKLKSE